MRKALKDHTKVDQNSRENVGSQENSKMLLQKLSHLIAKGKFKSWTGRKNLGLTFFCTQLQIRRNVTLLIPRICHTWSKGDIFKKLLGYLSLWHPVLPAVMKCRKIKQLQCMSDFTWNFLNILFFSRVLKFLYFLTYHRPFELISKQLS